MVRQVPHLPHLFRRPWTDPSGNKYYVCNPKREQFKILLIFQNCLVICLSNLNLGLYLSKTLFVISSSTNILQVFADVDMD